MIQTVSVVAVRAIPTVFASVAVYGSITIDPSKIEKLLKLR